MAPEPSGKAETEYTKDVWPERERIGEGLSKDQTLTELNISYMPTTKFSGVQLTCHWRNSRNPGRPASSSAL